jgi:hypothetical protein
VAWVEGNVVNMSGKKVRTKEETLGLICIYEFSPEFWDSWHIHFKDRDKRNMCYFPYCTACIVFFV